MHKLLVLANFVPLFHYLNLQYAIKYHVFKCVRKVCRQSNSPFATLNMSFFLGLLVAQVRLTYSYYLLFQSVQSIFQSMLLEIERQQNGSLEKKDDCTILWWQQAACLAGVIASIQTEKCLFEKYVFKNFSFRTRDSNCKLPQMAEGYHF